MTLYKTTAYEDDILKEWLFYPDIGAGIYELYYDKEDNYWDFT